MCSKSNARRVKSSADRKWFYYKNTSLTQVTLASLAIMCHCKHVSTPGSFMHYVASVPEHCETIAIALLVHQWILPRFTKEHSNGMLSTWVEINSCYCGVTWENCCWVAPSGTSNSLACKAQQCCALNTALRKGGRRNMLWSSHKLRQHAAWKHY